jgi:hypothetical protein
MFTLIFHSVNGNLYILILKVQKNISEISLQMNNLLKIEN